MQSNDIEDEAQKKSFSDSMDRIQVMSMIHEMLYESSNLSNIDFSEYARAISESLVTTYSNSRIIPRLSFDLEPVRFGIDTAISCGLIVNEVLTNSFKYAFSGECPPHDPTLSVGVRRSADGVVAIAIFDNGKGIPESVDPATATTLGLQLVVMLTRQIDGEWELGRDGGTRWTRRFNPQTR
ncbi:MAG: sensor histidine kinase [Spirochaetes bacterium]|nr:sensor histidine kinase [Spirochaetota bacterium]